MFAVIENPEFTHAVRVQVPVDGGHREETFKARFRVVDDEEVEALDFFRVAEVKAFLRRIVVSLDELVDETGQPLGYCDALRDRMLGLPHVRIALLKTYRDALSKVRAGN